MERIPVELEGQAEESELGKSWPVWELPTFTRYQESEARKQGDLEAEEQKYRERLLFGYANGPFHVASILEQCNSQLPRGTPVEITILDDHQRWSVDRFLSRELAKQLAKHPKVKVTKVVPKDSYSETEKRDAQRDGIRIIEADEKPGHINPSDWLAFPPKHFSTDIVIGVGEEMGKIAHIWKEHLQCKSVFLTREGLFPGEFIQRDLSPEEINAAFCLRADLPIATGPKMKENLTASLKYHNKEVFDLTPGIISEFLDINQSAEDGRKFRVLITGGNDPDKFHAEGLDIAAMAVAELKDKSYHASEE